MANSVERELWHTRLAIRLAISQVTCAFTLLVIHPTCNVQVFAGRFVVKGKEGEKKCEHFVSFDECIHVAVIAIYHNARETDGMKDTLRSPDGELPRSCNRSVPVERGLWYRWPRLSHFAVSENVRASAKVALLQTNCLKITCSLCPRRTRTSSIFATVKRSVFQILQSPGAPARISEARAITRRRYFSAF